MRQQIRDNYPGYDTPPPVDDTRPNETSWTYFKKVFDERYEKDAKKGGGH